MSNFFKGTILLAATAFISECIEFLINLTITKELGEYGVGQYMTIIPLIGLVMIIASMELPISISKFIAEKEEQYHLTMLKYAMKLTIIFISILLTVSILIFMIFPIFSEIHPLIRWVILLLVPIVSISSIARGYFVGIQKMGQVAVSNLLKRSTQLFILVFIYQMFDFQLEVAILIALFSLIGGELLVFIYLISAYVLQLRFLKNRPVVNIPKSQLAKSLMDVSVPTTAMRIFHSLTHAIQPFLIKYTLVAAGLSMGEATENFGLISGVAMTIGFFPAFIAHSLMTVLIPNVSQAFASHNHEQLLQLLKRVILLTSLYGIPVTIGFYYFADELTGIFVNSATASYFFQLMLPYFFLHYYTIPFQAFLIGMNLVKDAFLHNIWTTFISFLMIYFLGSNEHFVMDGIIVGMNMGAVLLMLLHYFTICKKIGISPLSLRKGDMFIPH